MRRKLSNIAVADRDVWPAAPTMGTFASIGTSGVTAVTLPGDATGLGFIPYFKSGSSYSVQRSNTGVLRFELRSGDFPTEDAGNSVERCEINQNGSLDKTKIVRWSFERMIEAGTDMQASSSFCILGQMHATEDASDIHTSPPITMNLGPNGSHTVISRSYYLPRPMSSANFVQINHVNTRLQRGVWYKHEFRFFEDAAPAGSGFLQYWRNGVPMVNYAGPIGYNQILGFSPQIGIYRSPDPSTMVVYYNNIQLYYE